MTALIEEVATNIYKIRLPMPSRLDHINVYVLREGKRLVMIDTGLPTKETGQKLQEGFSQLGLELGDLTDIFVTHSHPDHIGQLKHLRRDVPGARLYMHRRELSLMTNRVSLEQETYRWLLSHGATELAEEGADWRFMAAPVFGETDRILDGGEKLALGDGPEGQWEIMWTPGHTAGHFVLHNRARHLMLSGDHLLGQISSNIGKYPGSTDDPLGDYIASLNKIAELELQQVLPAHGLPFTDYRARAADLVSHHQRRLEKMFAAVESQPQTAAQVVKQIWGDRLVGFDRFLALVETLSHLERLRLEEKVVSEERNNLIYFRAA